MKFHLKDLRSDEASCHSKNALYITELANFIRSPEQQCKKCQKNLRKHAQWQLSVKINKEFPEHFKGNIVGLEMHDFTLFIGKELNTYSYLEGLIWENMFIWWIESDKAAHKEMFTKYLVSK